MNFYFFIKRYLFFVFFLLISLVSQSQEQVSFEHLGVRNGLSQTIVQSMCQDKEGFLWFGTQDGLNRYDGYNFKIFRTKQNDSNSIAGNIIAEVFVDSEGLIWCGGFGLLCFYDKNTEKFIIPPASINARLRENNVTVNHIAEDKNGDIWFATVGFGLLRLKKSAKKTGNFDVFTRRNRLSDSLPSANQINRIAFDKEGKMWLATVFGLNCATFDEKNVPHFKFLFNNPQNNQSIAENPVSDVCIDKEGKIWLGYFNNGISIFDPKKNTFSHFQNERDNPNSLTNNKISFFCKSENGDMWIGTQYGLTRFVRETQTFVQHYNESYNVYSLIGNRIFSVFEDRTGILWVGTGAGLDKYDAKKRHFLHYYRIPNSQYSINDNVIVGLTQDLEGNIWAGTQNNGINKINKKTGKVEIYSTNSPISHRIPDDNIRCLFCDSEGNIWVGTLNYGAVKIEKNGNIKLYQGVILGLTRRFNTVDDLKGEFLWGQRIESFCEDKEGNIWAGAAFGGNCLNKIDKKTGKIKYFPNFPGAGRAVVKYLYLDSEGFIWISTYIGTIIKFNPKTEESVSYFNNPDDKNSVPAGSAYAIHEYPNGIMWFGMYGVGLVKFDTRNNKFSLYNEKNGLLNLVIYGILNDKEGNIWVSTNLGIAKFDTKTETFKVYRESDGLQSDEFNSNSYFKSKDGMLFFAGINGITAFYPEKIKSNLHIPQVAFTDFQIFNKSILPSENAALKQSIITTKEIVLNHSENMFSFEFAALQYSYSEGNEYAHQMVGLDEDWVYDGKRRYVTYTKIPDGEYIFRVKAANSDGIWNEKGISLKIKVLPPFYKTWWFYSLEIISLILAIFLYIKIRERKLLQDKQVLENKVTERTIEIQMKNEELMMQNEEILAQRDEIETQRDEIEEKSKRLEIINDEIQVKNRNITDSIQYARRIQEAVLPPQEQINEILPENFILYKPKDIVSGDFYWIKFIPANEFHNNLVVVAAVDCTGHGVPGGFMSMLGVALLNEVIGKREINHANEVLEFLRSQIIESLRQTGKFGEAKDGMDISLCVIDKKINELEFAGANNSLYLVRNVEKQQTLIELKADKMPIGIHYMNKGKFTNKNILLQKNDVIYLFTDGYADQFSESGEKFMKSRFKKLLIEISEKSISEQREILEKNIEDWKGDREQLDDILVVGIKI